MRGSWVQLLLAARHRKPESDNLAGILHLYISKRGTANGNVEAKVVCFYRRRDISSTLIALADKHASESDGRDQSKLEIKVWDPNSPLTDKQIDQFLVVARSVGTFARALDCSSSIRQPSLHMSAAAASRDITLFHAMDTLHKNSFDISKAISALVPQGGPVLCRDEMEEWSASEANLFEEALEKYGKDFTDIQQDFLPWKSLTSIIEYYYMWKTTDRYVQQKRLKAAEAESKLKQVYIPNYYCWFVKLCDLTFDIVYFILEAHPCPKPDPPRSSTISMASLTPIKSMPILNNGSPTILGKRNYEQHNGMDGHAKSYREPTFEIVVQQVLKL
ncbi:MTA1 protein, partial [Polypterus senegalus]